jgi:hypothetical protein
MASAFDAAGIPFNVINLEAGNYSLHTDRSWSHKEARRSDYDTTIVCVNPDNTFYLRTQAPVDVLGNRYVIGNWYWELPELPDEWLKEFEFTDEVWGASRFICEAVSRKTSAPVVYMPPVVALSESADCHARSSDCLKTVTCFSRCSTRIACCNGRTRWACCAHSRLRFQPRITVLR